MAEIRRAVAVHGLPELDAALKALPVEVASLLMEQALTAAGTFIRDAAAANIHSRSGRTAADLRVEVQVDPAGNQGAGAIGGTTAKKTGRAYVLRWLEFGAGPHVIKAGEPERRQGRRVIRALRRAGDLEAVAAIRLGLRGGQIRVKRALRLPGGIFRAAVNHPGVTPQSPLTRALAEQGAQAIRVFQDTLWAGIERFAARVPKVKAR